MPELAEVEHYRRLWNPGLGDAVLRVTLHPLSRDFRGTNAVRLRRRLPGAVLAGSEARGKQMLFRFSSVRRSSGETEGLWLGVHLGMTGKLRLQEQGGFSAHDHLILHLRDRFLVFSDPRQFGRVLFAEGEAEPSWWSDLPPALLSPEFGLDEVSRFLRRHGRAPIKAVLLRQERFPGVGNWMADEILYRSRIHPGRLAGRLSALEVARLWGQIKRVAAVALRRIADEERDLPRRWLFHQRWRDGGHCPETGGLLVRETIGGRTTCWSRALQKPDPGGGKREQGVLSGHKGVDTRAFPSG